ncbi:MAG: HD domain-containing protein, partial [Anaerolineae bacterium]
MNPSQPSLQDSLRPYAGRWVALVDGRFVAQGGTPEQALQAARLIRSKERITLRYIPMHNTLPFPPLLHRIVQVLPDDVTMYLVGGAVRDALRGRTSHDLDFAVQGNARAMARRVADALGAAYYPLHDDIDAGRMVLQEDDQRFMVDFVGLHPQGLEADLRARDFTINAIAVDVRAPQQLLDPLGGAAALRQGELRACASTSVLDDPVRLLRAIRLAASLGLRISPDTRKQMRAAVPLLARVSPERIRFELMRILGGVQPATSLRALDMLGALAAVLPETAALKGVVQSPPHVYPVWEHTLAVVERLDALLNALGPDYDADTSANNLVLGHAVLRLGRYRQRLSEHLSVELTPDVSRRALLFLAAVYHDIAKPQTRSVDSDGRIRFFGHEEQGASIVGRRMRALHMSGEEIGIVKRIVKNHMRPLLLGYDKAMPSRRAVYRLFRQTGDAGVDVCVLSLADFLGTYGP